jgi:hypothetical protein
VKANKIKYEALSWCWGIDPPLYAVQIGKDGKTWQEKCQEGTCASAEVSPPSVPDKDSLDRCDLYQPG